MESFNDLPGLTVTEALQQALEADGIFVPTAIQAEGFAPIYAGRNVVLRSGTGTGKTLAYLLPLLQRLSQGRTKRAVVLSPGAELALQILRVAERYMPRDIASGALVPSGSYAHQKARIQKSTRFIAGTPGRVLEMYRARKLKNVELLVLDEPDHTLTGKEANYLREIVSRPEPKLQVVIVGATIGPPTQSFIEDSLEDTVRVRADDEPLHERIRHVVVGVRENEPKDVRVARFIDKHRCKRAYLFVGQEKLVGHLYRYLFEHGHKPVTLGRERSKDERKKAVQEFRLGEAKILITSDTGARGLDVADVPWVLHYEIPYSAAVYLHRSGRTGRAGKEGTSVSFCSPRERVRLKSFAKELGLQFESDSSRR